MELNVIIPVYNSGSYIQQLLNLMEPQLCFVDKVIFVDDSSQDNSYEILSNWTKRFDNVDVYIGKNKGASGARQEGLYHVQEGYVTFVDSDDRIAEDYFKNLRNILSENEDFDMYVLSYSTNFSDKRLLPRINKPGVFCDGKEYAKSIENGDTIGDMALWNHIYNVGFLKRFNIEFDIDAQIAEDSLFNDLCILHATRVLVSDYNGYTWISRQHSLTGRCPLNMGETLRRHIDYCTMIQLKYGLLNEFVLKRKKWAFSYLVHNIISSQHPENRKENLLCNALKMNLDKEVIEYGYSGYEKKLLCKSYDTGDTKYYSIYLKYNFKSLVSKLLVCIGKLKRKLLRLC